MSIKRKIKKNSLIRKIFQRSKFVRKLYFSAASPCYEADGMRLFGKNMDFIKDERFIRAYQRGMSTSHKIGRPKGSDLDIHIEWRAHFACWAAHHASLIEGDFVECGVNSGILSLAICDYLEFNNLEKDFYLFDTFEGIPESQMSEREVEDRIKENADLYEECYEDTKVAFKDFVNVKLVRGMVPDSLSSVDIEKVAYLSLDMNIAYPERAAMEYFWDRLVPGAIVLLDDYGWEHYREQKQSLDEFARIKGVAIATLPTGQGMLLKA